MMGHKEAIHTMDSEGEWSSQEEKKKVELMRAFVKREDPDSEEYDDTMLRRFLRARDLNIEKASAMFLKFLKWRKVEVPNGFISTAEIQNELAQRKLFSQGFDKKGHPIGVILGGRHLYSQRDINEFKRSVVYGLDKLCSRMTSGKERFTCIADVKGWRYVNCDIRAYLAALEIMQNYYPERLYKVFLVHVPYLFMKAWKAIYPFIDNKTKKKFVFMEDKNMKETLLGDIEESQLPDIYGGKLQLVPVEET